MSYIVLARKYRPQNFNEVYAQEHVTTILKNAIAIDRLAHAFLFTGSRGVGKTSMARILAKSLNCMKGMSPTPCGVCDNCVEITAGTSTDVVEIDGASNTGVEDIRDLQKELMYSTSKSKFKIFIIDEVHMLSKNAFNALLKTLEEPPAQVIFIFATTEPHKVLPTIISRCQRYDFKRIPIEAIVRRLQYICEKENISIEEEALYVIGKKAEGSMRDALSLTDQLIATSKNNITTNDVLSLFGIVHTDVYHKITEYIHKKETGAIISLIHGLLDKGNDLQEFLGGYLDYLRTLLLLKANVPLPELPASLREELKGIEPLFSEDSILYLMAILIKTKNEVKYFSNPVLLLEMTFIKLSKMEEMKSITELLKNWHSEDSRSQAPTQTAHVRPTRPAARPVPYKSPEPQRETIKEPAYEPPAYEKLTEAVFEKEKDKLIATLYGAKPVVASYFKKLVLEKVVDNKLFFSIGDKSAFDYLSSHKSTLTPFISRFFKLDVVLMFNYKAPEAEEKGKMIKNPTLQDIQRESPELAKFIELSEASVTPVKSRE